MGQAVVHLLDHPENRSQFTAVRALVKNTTRPRDTAIGITTDPDDILDDPAIDVVIEVMGGRTPAKDFILRALRNGKPVVTANKEVIAYDGPELLKSARQSGCALRYEAAVGGGIPIIAPLQDHISNVPVYSIRGVLNGTVNFILTEMNRGLSYDQAVQEAQRLGYAEADPSADVNGQDSVRKIAILADIAFGVWVNPEDIMCQGLETAPLSRLDLLREHNLGIRLVASASLQDDGLHMGVHPMVFPAHHRFMQLSGAQNGVEIRSEIGDTWVEGPGAGGLATATSIVADLKRIHQPPGQATTMHQVHPETLSTPWLALTDKRSARWPEHPAPLMSWGPSIRVYAHALDTDPGDPIVQLHYGGPLL